MPEVPQPDMPHQRSPGVDLDVLWTALAHAHDSIIVYERPVATTKPRIVYVNEATIRQSGFSRDELLGGSTGTGPDTDLEAVRTLRDAMLRGEPMRLRLALYRKDGSMYWGDIDGRPVRDAAGTVTHWISIERDISAAVERERALAALLGASRSIFGVLEGAALDAAFLHALHTVLGADAAFAADESDPLVARALAGDGIVGDDAGRFAVALRSPGRDPRVAVVEHDGKRAAGPIDPAVLALLAQTYSAASRNAALFDEVHQQRAAVLELSRMKGDLITMLAHDLNNPLTAIRGFAEYLAEEHAGNSDDALATTAIVRATERLVDLGKETLALARLEDNALVLTRSPIDYGTLLARIAAELAPGIAVAAEGDVYGTGDAVLIHGLFENVLRNAVKYSSPESVSVRVRGDDSTVAVEVEDRGTGIPFGQISRVFDRFARDTIARETDVPGTGFGLYFVRLVVQRHGGTIAVDSRVDEGTCVVVRLPRNPQFTVPPSILVLERDQHAASYTNHILRDAGYRVRVVHDLAAFEAALGSDATAVAIVPEGAHDALAAARAAGIHALELHKPYLARDLLRELEAVS